MHIQERLKQIAKWMIIASFFVPLLILPTQFIFPFIVPKIITFRILSIVLLGLFFLLFAIDKQSYTPKRSLIHGAVLFFLLTHAVSTFVGIDWYRSFWDNHERMLGLFTLVHYGMYYLVASLVIRTFDEWKVLLRWFLFAGGIVMFIGFLQLYINPNLLLNAGADRVSSTLGNAIYYSAYGMFLFFIGLMLSFKETTSFWRWYAIVGSLLGFGGVFWGGTRGTFLGLFAGIGVLTLLYVFSLKSSVAYKKIRMICIGLLATGILCVALFFVFRHTQFVRELPAIGRLTEITVESLESNTRIMAWKVAIDIWKGAPFFGIGPNNYFYGFNTLYNPEFLRHGWGETWFDNAHSVVMNTLSTGGTFGFLAYMGLFLSAIIVLFQSYSRGRIDMHIRNIGVAFLVGHFVHNIFVFENPTSYLYFFFFLAMIASISSQSKSAIQKGKNVSGGYMVFVSVCVVVVVFITNINPARANMAALETIYAVTRGTGPIAAYEKTVAIPTPHIDDVRNDVAKTIRESIQGYIDAGREAEAKELFFLAYTELEKNLSIHPFDIRVHLQRAGMAQVGAQLTLDPAYVLEAKKLLEQAIELSPKRQQLYYQLATVYMQMGDMQKAEELYKTTIEFDPVISEGWWRLALLYEDAGLHEQAVQTIQQARTEGVVFSEPGKGIVENILNPKLSL